MEDLIAKEDVGGQQRIRGAADRRDTWIAGKVEEHAADEVVELKELPRRPADVSSPAVIAEGDFENLENADASVRAALLGKGNKRAFTADKTTAQLERDVDMSPERPSSKTAKF